MQFIIYVLNLLINNKFDEKLNNWISFIECKVFTITNLWDTEYFYVSHKLCISCSSYIFNNK